MMSTLTNQFLEGAAGTFLTMPYLLASHLTYEFLIGKEPSIETIAVGAAIANSAWYASIQSGVNTLVSPISILYWKDNTRAISKAVEPFFGSKAANAMGLITSCALAPGIGSLISNATKSIVKTSSRATGLMIKWTYNCLPRYSTGAMIGAYIGHQFRIPKLKLLSTFAGLIIGSSLESLENTPSFVNRSVEILDWGFDESMDGMKVMLGMIALTYITAKLSH